MFIPITGFAFLCPNGTLFNQEVFVCDWYQHVDCSSSENFYGKNAALNMKIDNMSDMMAIVNEMMTFPMKSTNQQRPTMLPNIGNTNVQPTTRRPFTLVTSFPSVSQTSTNLRPITLPSTSSPSPTTPNQFRNRVSSAKPQQTTEATPNQRQPEFETGTKTITNEGDLEFNSKTQTDRFKTENETTVSNQPIFISSLGELSSDVGDRFDINKARIIKPAENTVFTPPTVSKEEQMKNQLKQSLSESFKNSENNNNKQSAVNSGENNLLEGLQRALQQNPNGLSAEDDLLQFVQRILKQNPDLTPDQLNYILSKESDAILAVLNDAIDRNQDTGNGQSRTNVQKNGENNLLESVQNILNKHKNGEKFVSLPPNGARIPVESGESDLLDTLQRILKQSQIPIFSGEADLVQFIERLKQQNPDFTAQELNAIISGEADSILSFLNEKRKANGSAVSSGEADLLEAIQRVLQKYRDNVSGLSNSLQPPFETGLAVDNQQVVATTESNFDKNRFSQRLRQPTSTSDRIVNQQNNNADDSSGQAFFNQNANNEVNRNKPVSAGASQIPSAAGVGSLPQEQKKPISPVAEALTLARVPNKDINNGLQAIESGEADLLETLRMIALRIPNKQSPVFSGEADLLQFIEQIKQQNPDISTNQLNAIISGEANSILRIFNGNAQQNQDGLLRAIQSIVDKYRQNNEGLAPPLPELMFSGEMALLSTIQKIQQQRQIPIFSGEADLLQFIRQIEQQNPGFTPNQLNAIISGEVDSILRILNEKVQSRNSSISSGEADLLDAIQQVLQKYRNNPSSSPASGEGDLQQTLQRIQQESQIPIFSGEADLVQFIERIQRKYPEFSAKELNNIISGELDSILQILREKKQRNQSNSFAVSSGEADLLDAIQLVLEKYRGKTNSNTASPQTPFVVSGDSYLLETLQKIQQQSPTPIFSGEADLLQFIELIKQQNPEFTTDQLSAIIFSETTSILRDLNEKARKNQFAVSSGQADLLDAIQLALQKYKSNPTTPSNRDEINLIESLRHIQEQSARPIFSGDAEISEFTQRLHQRNPDLSSKELSEIISKETNSIVQILNDNKQNFKDFDPSTGEDDLLVAVQYYVEMYTKFENGTSTVSPTQQQSPPNAQQNTPIALPNASFGSADDIGLLQTVKYIGAQIRVPIFSGEADLVQFIERVKQLNLEFTSNQLNAIISSEADSILQTLNQAIQRKQIKGIAVESGEADLLDSIQLVLQKYKGKSVSQSSGSSSGSSVPSLPVSSGESDLLQALRRIQQESAVPIFSGEADLVQFIEQIRQSNPDLTENQLASIISGEANSILQILSDKGRSVSSGEAELFSAIYEVLQKYRRNYQNPTQFTPNQFGQTISGQTNFAKVTPSYSGQNQVRNDLHFVSRKKKQTKMTFVFNFRAFKLRK